MRYRLLLFFFVFLYTISAYGQSGILSSPPFVGEGAVISDLGDVDASGVSDDDIFQYNVVTQKWEPIDNDVDLTNTWTITAAPWSVFYSDGSGNVIELPIGASGEVLKSTGPSSALSWQADIGSGSGAPEDAAYLTSTSNATLTSETVITPTDDYTIVGNGSSWIIKQLPSNCSDANDKLLYNNTTNTFSCGTDDDVPDAGDFGNATDLDSNGALNTDSVDSAEIVADAVGSSELDQTANYTLTGTVDLSGGSLEVPNSGTLPGSCVSDGEIYVDTGATAGQQIYVCDGGSFVLQGDGGGGGGGNTLDSAYDQGGAGAGRSVTVDSGAIEFTGSNAADDTLEVSSNAAGGSLRVANTGTGHTVLFEDAASDSSPFIIDNEGDVSIGTTATALPFHVVNDAEQIARFESNDAIADIRVADSGGQLAIMGISGTDSFFGADSSRTSVNNMIVTTAGLFGLGDISPENKVDIGGGNLGFDANAYINWNNTDGSDGYGFRDNGGEMEFRDNSDAPGVWTPIASAAASVFWQIVNSNASVQPTSNRDVLLQNDLGISSRNAADSSNLSMMVVDGDDNLNIGVDTHVFVQDGDFESGTATTTDATGEVLTDSTQSWTTNAMIGWRVQNLADHGRCIITSNTTTTATCASPGLHDDTNLTDAAWTSGDEYTITPPEVAVFFDSPQFYPPTGNPFSFTPLYLFSDTDMDSTTSPPSATENAETVFMVEGLDTADTGASTHHQKVAFCPSMRGGGNVEHNSNLWTMNPVLWVDSNWSGQFAWNQEVDILNTSGNDFGRKTNANGGGNDTNHSSRSSYSNPQALVSGIGIFGTSQQVAGANLDAAISIEMNVTDAPGVGAWWDFGVLVNGVATVIEGYQASNSIADLMTLYHGTLHESVQVETFSVDYLGNVNMRNDLASLDSSGNWDILLSIDGSDNVFIGQGTASDKALDLGFGITTGLIGIGESITTGSVRLGYGMTSGEVFSGGAALNIQPSIASARRAEISLQPLDTTQDGIVRFSDDGGSSAEAWLLFDNSANTFYLDASGTTGNDLSLVSGATTGDVNIVAGRDVKLTADTLVFNTWDVLEMSTSLQLGSGLSSQNVGIGVNTSGTIFMGGTGSLTTAYAMALTNFPSTGTVPLYKDASGNIATLSSDLRLKEKIELIKNPLDILKQVKGVTFRMKDDPEDHKRRVGVIAQDWLDVLPEVTFSYQKEGLGTYYGVNYGKISALLIECLKAQQVQIEELQRQVSL